MIIRQATIHDAAAIAPLFDGYRTFYRRKHIPLDEIAVFIQARIKNEESVVFMTELDGQAVGVAQLYPAYSTLSLSKTWTLYDLFIDKAHRGQGIGKALIQHCEAFSRQDGAFKLEVKTEANNEPARATYERHGFEEDTKFVHYQLMLD